MATINWISTHGEFEWLDGANWSGGVVPGTADVANLHSNAALQIDVDGAVNVGIIKFFDRNATLVEAADASITARVLEIGQGVLTLNAANSFAQVTFEGGTALIGNDHALGVKPISGDGFVEAVATSVNFHNAFDIAGIGGFGAAEGDTLKVSGALTFSSPTAGTGIINFGTGGGLVSMTSTSFVSDVETYDVQLIAGRFKSGEAAHAQGANALFSGADTVFVDPPATLDIRDFGTNVTLNRLTGPGTLLGTGVTAHVTDPSFTGTLSNVTMEVGGTGSIGGHPGHAAFTMAAGTDSLDFSGMLDGSIVVSAPEGSDATLTLGTKTTAHFTDFAAGDLTLIVDVASNSHVSFTESGGTTRMAIHIGGGASPILLFFEDVGVAGDLSLGDDGHGHLEVTSGGAAAIPPHDFL
jgi:hypothetical protein